MFERAGELLDEYERAAVRANVSLNKTATSEVRTTPLPRHHAGHGSRLRYATRCAREASSKSKDSDTFGRWFNHADKARILIETFYFNCGRIGGLPKNASGSRTSAIPGSSVAHFGSP